MRFKLMNGWLKRMRDNYINACYVYSTFGAEDEQKIIVI